MGDGDEGRCVMMIKGKGLDLFFQRELTSREFTLVKTKEKKSKVTYIAVISLSTANNKIPLTFQVPTSNLCLSWEIIDVAYKQLLFLNETQLKFKQ